MPSLVDCPVYAELRAHHDAVRELHLRRLFAEDPGRFSRFSIGLGDLLFDYSKHRITAETVPLLARLAEEAGVPEAIVAMFAGERINRTENRAVLHTALRNRSASPVRLDGRDVMPAVRGVLAKMRRLSEAIAAGAWLGQTGQPIRDVVNIGIGGSDLGPQMVAEALRPYWREGMRAHFVSNVDGSQLEETLRGLDPARTFFVVVSKTFTTQETLTNARSARSWLQSKLLEPEGAVARHFVAVSTNRAGVAEFGIDPENMLEFWDWVGGRYSLWSAVGLSVACVVGMDRFDELLAGAHAVDVHFRTAPLAENIPVLMALLGVWYTNFFGAAAHAVLPYDQHLHRLPAHLQQLDMESNGKSVGLDDRPITDYETGPVLFGEPGTNGQHAFYQLLHQGTRMVPADFIAAANPHHDLAEHHPILLSHFLAQTEALMRGKSEEEVRGELEAQGLTAAEVDRLAPHKVFAGNRPTTSILLRRLTPTTLGQLVALYEHKVFVQGVLWNVDSFDQWGVELGKELAKRVLPALEGGEEGEAEHDASTAGLLERCRDWQ